MRSNRFVVACGATSALATDADARIVLLAVAAVGLVRRREGHLGAARRAVRHRLALLPAVRRDAGLGRVGHGRPLSRCRPEGGAVLTIFSCPCIAVKPH